MFSCRKNAIFPGAHKLAQPFPAPELQSKNYTDTRIFLFIDFPQILLNPLELLGNQAGEDLRSQPLCALSDFPFKIAAPQQKRLTIRKAPDAFKFLRHVMRAILSVWPKCSHRCVSRKETPLKPAQNLKHATRKSTKQTSMRTKWFKHIAIQTVQEHLRYKKGHGEPESLESSPSSLEEFLLEV